jgi:ATP-dependent helicase/nuclease subunit A
MGVLVDWPGESPAPVRFVFLASESQPPACAVDALSDERREREREELNTLYVAMTRARHTLAVSSIEPYQPSGRSWWSRLEPLADGVAPVDQVLNQALNLAPVPLANAFDLKVLPLGPQRLGSADAQTSRPGVAVVPEALPLSESVLARLGLAMHRLLEWGDDSVPAARAAAQEFGLDAEQGAQAAAMAEAIMHGEGAWAWDPQVLSWAGNEVTLVYCGQTLRLDRLVQRRDLGHAGHWWVLDYKSSAAPLQQPALVEQLRQYQKAVQSAYPDEVVHAAFLTARGAMVVLEK